MALVFPQCSFHLSPLSNSNKGKFALIQGQGGQKRVPSLGKRCRGNHVIRCESVASSVVDGGVPGATIAPAEIPSIKRSDFPTDFVFGAATSAIQTEGPAGIGGRGASTWDYMITQGDEFDGKPSSDDVATLSYKLYKEDVKLLKNMGMDVYRFSISWSRILPNGKGDINQEGIDFYKNLISELQDNGIEPFVTLFHFDLPQALQDEYGGFMSSDIVKDFVEYCQICFEQFGGQVKNWLTVNEAWSYAMSVKPPADTYTVGHNIILAHAAAVKLYRESFQPTQGGQIGMPLTVEWFKPHSISLQDKEAAERAFSFQVGWFVEPLVYGDYPFIMKALAGDTLPSFKDEEKEMVKGSYDFLGVNYYTSNYAKALPISSDYVPQGYFKDQYYEPLTQRDGKLIGVPDPGNSNIYVVPDGLRDALIYMKLNYLNPTIYITENGVSEPRDDTLPLKEALKDEFRVKAIQVHLQAVQEALSRDVNVKGYIAWALLDCMEVGSGYNVRFGLNYTDYLNDLKRYPKYSALWFKNFLKKD